MILQEGNLKFNFSDAIHVFKFDEPDRSLPNFHGLSHCMKAVDFVAEYDNYYLFVEIKDPTDPARYGSSEDKNKLLKNLTTKFRDTFIYRWAGEKLDKPIHYHCLVELDNAQTLYLMNQLQNQLPAKKIPNSWSKPLVKSCTVANTASWNLAFPNIQVARV